MNVIENWLREEQAWFLHYPLFIQIALVVIIACICMMVAANIWILLSRINYARYQLQVVRVKRIVNTEITRNLMLKDAVKETDVNRVASRFKRLYLSNTVFSTVVKDELIFYRRNFSDRLGKLVYLLFNKLELMERSLAKLKRSAWEVKAEGLREIQEMPPSPKTIQDIIPFLNDKNDDLRIEAQAAFIRLNNQEPFAFLTNAEEELLDWHQIILFELITNTPDLAVPQFKKWLQSANDSVITFCIKMIIHFQQLDAIPALIDILDHDNLNVRKAAILALECLDAETAEQKLVDMYPSQPIPVKISILGALGGMATGRQLAFLKNEFRNTEEFDLAKSAGCALSNQPGFDGEDFVHGDGSLTARQQEIMSHCLNLLIRN